MRAGDPLATAERQGRRVGEHGYRVGSLGLGDGRSLDANAGELRAGAGAAGEDRCRRTGGCAAPMNLPTRLQQLRFQPTMDGEALRGWPEPQPAVFVVILLIYNERHGIGVGCVGE